MVVYKALLIYIYEKLCICNCNEGYFDCLPFFAPQVLRRTLQIFYGVGSFAFKLWVDKLQGQLDQNKRLRAIELRNIFTGLGPTFVKIGQGLSTRPDLCPPEYLEELSELQVFF